MNLSVIIPAFNEEMELPICLEHVKLAFADATRRHHDFTWELIVTDNNSTDRTSEIAERAGAQVVFEPVNQIARARNAGAAQAKGDWLLFIDADSRLHVESIREMLDLIDSNSCGAGGCLIRMDDAPFWGRRAIQVWNTVSRTMNWAAGSFIFCRGDAFRAVAGFDEQFFAAEELYFSSAVKKWCRDNSLRFIILRKQPHASSSRKFRMYSAVETLKLFRNVFLCYGRTVRSRAALDYFYDGRR